MTVGVWDTAGSERYEAMSRMYYRNAKVLFIKTEIRYMIFNYLKKKFSVFAITFLLFLSPSILPFFSFT